MEIGILNVKEQERTEKKTARTLIEVSPTCSRCPKNVRSTTGKYPT